VDAEKRVLGEYHATGYIPSFMEDMRIRGISLSDDIFRIA